MTKLIVAFHNFANAPKSRKYVICSQIGEIFCARDYCLKFLFYNAFSELLIRLQYIQKTCGYVSEEKHYKSNTKIFYLNHTKSLIKYKVYILFVSTIMFYTNKDNVAFKLNFICCLVIYKFLYQ
jgi:hypothetical protein